MRAIPHITHSSSAIRHGSQLLLLSTSSAMTGEKFVSWKHFQVSLHLWCTIAPNWHNVSPPMWNTCSHSGQRSIDCPCQWHWGQWFQVSNQWWKSIEVDWLNTGLLGAMGLWGKHRDTFLRRSASMYNLDLWLKSGADLEDRSCAQRFWLAIMFLLRCCFVQITSRIVAGMLLVV